MRYRECTDRSERYHEFKRRADSKGSEQLVLRVDKEKKVKREKGKKKADGTRKGSAEGDANGHEVSLVTGNREY